jgi:predicted esterase
VDAAHGLTDTGRLRWLACPFSTLRWLFATLRDALAGALQGSGARLGGGAVDRSVAFAGTRVLMFAGLRDPRFPYEWVKRQADALRTAGSEVELAGLDADLVLTHAQEWTARFDA